MRNHWKNLCPEAIESDIDIKSYQKIFKNPKGQGEDYTTGCLLDYDYIKKSLYINSNWFE